MARKIVERPPVTKPLLGIMTPTCDYIMERVTRIELALSAWEAQRLRLPGAADLASLAVPSDPG
jgi:hypothetical protein